MTSEPTFGRAPPASVPPPSSRPSVAPNSGTDFRAETPYRLPNLSVIGGSFETSPAALAELRRAMFGDASEWGAASNELFFDLGRVGGPAPWWFLCFRMLVRRGVTGEVRIAVTHAFIDIDRMPALTVGREIFGFPALAAKFIAAEPRENGSALGADGSVTIETDVLTATSHAVERLEIARVSWKARAEGPPSRVNWHEVRSAYPKLGPIPFVQLKQFRDAIEPDHACYQKFVFGDVSLDDRGEPGGLEPSLSVHDYRSFPLATSLGQRTPSSSTDGDGVADVTMRHGYSVDGLALTFSIPATTQPDLPSKQRANFRFRGGDPQFAPEYDFRKVTLTGFMLPASRARLKHLIDEQLNWRLPGNRSYSYEPVASEVIVEYIEYGSMVAANPPPHLTIDDSAGQHELVFRVLVGRVDRGSRIAKKPAMFCPFVFVDSTWSLISGREIMGYPKNLAHFKRYRDEGELAACCVQARDLGGALTGVVTLDCRRDQTFWDIDFARDDQPRPASSAHVPPSKRKEGGSRAHPWWGLDSLQGSADFGNVVGPWLRGLDYGFGAVLFKSFPDASTPQNACYVEVLEGDYIIQNADVNLPPFRARLDFGLNDPFGLKAKFGFGEHVLVPSGSWYRATCDFRVRILDPLG